MMPAKVRITCGGINSWRVEISEQCVTEPVDGRTGVEYIGRCDSNTTLTRRGAIRWAKRTAKRWADRDRAVTAAETFQVQL